MTPSWLLAVTLLAYAAGLAVQRRVPGRPWANPVLIGVVATAGVLRLVGASTDEFADATRPLAWLLPPATVALAWPLYRARAVIAPVLMPVLLVVVAGLASAVLSGVALASVLGAPALLTRAMVCKSVTAAVALAIAREVGADPAVAVGVAVLTGLTVGVIGLRILDVAGVRDPRARGLAMGVAGHGIGTARALAEGATLGAFAGLGMGVAGAVGGLLIPAAVVGLKL